MGKGGIVFLLLKKEERFDITQYENGSHVVKLIVRNTDHKIFVAALAKKNILIPEPGPTGFNLKINPSINFVTAEYLAKQFVDSLNG